MLKPSNLHDGITSDIKPTSLRQMTTQDSLDKDIAIASRHPVVTLMIIAALIGVSLWYFQATTKNPALKPEVAGVIEKKNKEVSIKNGATKPIILPTSDITRTLSKDKYPDPDKTPGAIYQNITKADVCDLGYAKRVRNVPSLQKKQIYESYGMNYPQPAGAYEVDHFIPLSIGGSNDSKNLWPEPASPTPGFHEKDRVEFYLYNQVCNGGISLKDAQEAIRTDWHKVLQNMPQSLFEIGFDPDGLDDDGD